jgi:hypothetical protein
MPIIPATWEAEIGGLQSEDSLGKKYKFLSEKQIKSVARSVEHLSSKCKVLNSNSSTAKKKEGAAHMCA